MKYQNCKHWTDLDKLSGLLFFAQSVDEMLFDYTLDSYKPLALNSRLLCIEVLSTLEEIKNGFVPKKSLQAVLEELKWSLLSDVAAQKLLGQKFSLYVNKIKPNDFKIQETENVISFLYHAFEDRKYLTQITKSLTECVIDGQKKETIRSLTGTFLSELMNYGYHPNHIYYQNSNFFFNKNKKAEIKAPGEILDFINIFDFKSNEFTVVFIGDRIFQNFRTTLKTFEIVVSNKYNCFSKMRDDIAFKDSKGDNKKFVICSNVKALDHHSARETIEGLLGQVSGIFNFYHHKEKPNIYDTSVVQRKADNYVVVIDKPTRSVLKTKVEESPYEAAKSVEETLSILNLEQESTYRFARSIELHSTALTSNATENQLLDLWASLETLLPKSSDSNKDRIVQICDSLLPFLQLNYIKKQLEEIQKDLFLWNVDESKKLLQKLQNAEDYSDLEKIGALIALDSNVALRTEIYSQLIDFPLLKNRIYVLHESFNSPENIIKSLKNHNVKINWHLRRIYRVRGLIIHSGKYPSYTSLLIENLHNYLDIFLKRIIDLSKNGTIKTIEEGIFETATALDFQLELLEKHKGEPLTETNFKEALLGEKYNTSA
jgi:hypothetical protein